MQLRECDEARGCTLTQIEVMQVLINGFQSYTILRYGFKSMETTKPDIFFSNKCSYMNIRFVTTTPNFQVWSIIATALVKLTSKRAHECDEA